LHQTHTPQKRSKTMICETILAEFIYRCTGTELAALMQTNKL